MATRVAQDAEGNTEDNGKGTPQIEKARSKQARSKQAGPKQVESKQAESNGTGKGLVIERRFTTEGVSPYDTVVWSKRDSRITNPDGSVVFEMKDAEIPAAWSQVAADIMVSKYFRKAGVPQYDENGSPEVDWEGKPVFGPERSARQVISRLASTWRWWGEEHGYFADEESAQVFEDELAYMLLHQMAAPNSPQWFNTGLAHAYGITGTAEGFWYVDPDTEEMMASPDSYTRPAPHACFPAGTLIAVDGGTKPVEAIEAGDLVLTHRGRYRAVTETMVRQVDEPLVRLNLLRRSNGGSVGNVVPKGLVATENHPILAFRKAAIDTAAPTDLEPEWIDAGKLDAGDLAVIVTAITATPRVGDYTVAGVAGTEQVPFRGPVYNFSVDEDESYVADGVVVHNCFIQSVDDDLVNEGGIMDLWVREARLFKFGSGTGTNFSSIRAEGERLSGGGKSSGLMSFLKVGDRAAGAIKSGGTTRRAAKMVILDIDHPDVETFIHWKAEEENKVRALIAAGYPSDFNGEAYATVSGQNSNNSVRLSNEFVQAVLSDADWDLTARTDGSVMKTVKARDLWHQIADAAWQCADPGVQFDTTIQEWHTSPAGGRIRATNPCAEYVFLDNTACNLASLNLVKFYDPVSGNYDLEAYRHAIRLWTMVLEISVTMAHFPSAEIAQGSYDYRTLGLGYANLGSLLMRMGIPYDSEEGRGIAGALTAILTGYSYATSAEMAEALGPFPKYSDNAESMLRVMRNHRRAAYNAADDEYDGVSTHVMGIDPDVTPSDMVHEAQNAWNIAVKMGEEYGYRNAQATVLAPTGCLVGGSLVPTERGLVRLASLGDPDGKQWQDLNVAVGTDEGARTATQFYVNGVEPVVTVETSRGYRIQGTPTHRIKVVNARGDWEWKRFGDISPDDVVPLQMNQLVGEPQTVNLPPKPRDLNLVEGTGEMDQVIDLPRTMTPELAELAGLFVSTGHIASHTMHFRIDDADEERIKHLASVNFNLGAEIHDGTIRTAIVKSKRLAIWWHREGLSTTLHGHELTGIPSAVLKTNDRSVYEAFVEGILDIDGRARFSNESIACEVQTLLLAVGRTSSLIRTHDEMWPWLLIADKENRTTDGFFYDTVAIAELGEEQLTYDLSVPDNVTYVANGFVSHNTIGLLMDCDTTGVEPDFALVKFKKLAGGGYFKIANQSIEPALHHLGYDERQIEQIIDYVVGTMKLHRAPHVNTASLIAKGFTADDVDKVEAVLPGVFELGFAFNQWTLGEETLQRLGFTPQQYNSPSFDMLRELGYSAQDIQEANDYVCGRQTIEGALALREEHLPVFDCANRNGKTGERFIHHTGHIKMMAAAQPFISGAISKTINMPNDVSIEDIEESYRMSWELGLKAMALYRDGSKASQPLSATSEEGTSEEEDEAIEEAIIVERQIHGGMFHPGISPTEAYRDLPRPRFLLPGRRSGFTQEARIGGHKLFMRTGEYEDGTLGELFLDLAKEGATLRGILSCFAIAVSKGLQYGVPLDEFVDTFTFQTFEPRGMVEGHPNIKMANSIVDYVFRALGVEYLHRDELAQVPPERAGLPEPPKGAAVDAGYQPELVEAVMEDDIDAQKAAAAFADTTVDLREEDEPTVHTNGTSTPVGISDGPGTLAAKSATGVQTAAVQAVLADKMGDAPLCDTCGHITVRNGSCYRCLNCGDSKGCS